MLAQAGLNKCKNNDDVMIWSIKCSSNSAFGVSIKRNVPSSSWAYKNEILVGNLKANKIDGLGIKWRHNGEILIGKFGKDNFFQGTIIFGQNITNGTWVLLNHVAEDKDRDYGYAQRAIDNAKKYLVNSDDRILEGLYKKLILRSHDLYIFYKDYGGVYGVKKSNAKELERKDKELSDKEYEIYRLKKKVKDRWSGWWILAAAIVAFVIGVVVSDDGEASNKSEHEKLNEKERHLKDILEKERRITELEAKIGAQQTEREKYMEIIRKMKRR